MNRKVFVKNDGTPETTRLILEYFISLGGNNDRDLVDDDYYYYFLEKHTLYINAVSSRHSFVLDDLKEISIADIQVSLYGHKSSNTDEKAMFKNIMKRIKNNKLTHNE